MVKREKEEEREIPGMGDNNLDYMLDGLLAWSRNIHAHLLRKRQATKEAPPRHHISVSYGVKSMRRRLLHCMAAHATTSHPSGYESVTNSSVCVSFDGGMRSQGDGFVLQVSRPALFRRSMRHFSVAWWAYSFPLTVLALAATEYAQEVKAAAANLLMLVLSVLSVLVTLALMVLTVIRTGDLLPRDDPFVCATSAAGGATR